MSEVLKVPELRFKGFSDAWVFQEFSNFVFRVTTSSALKCLPRVEYEDIISEGGILNKDIYQKESDKKGIEFDEGDILFGKLRPYLRNWLLPEFTGIAVGDFWVFRSKNINNKFLYFLIQGKKYQTIANLSTGTKMPRSDWSVVSKSEFLIPITNNEQTKIGTFFQQLDNRITLQQRKCEKLKNIKKSMLEKMFPKEGSNVPEIRFAGFLDDWNIVKLSDLSFFIDGNYGEKYPKENEFIEYGVPFFTSAVIGTSGDFNKKYVKFISEEKNSMLIKAQSLGGDLILTNRGASMGTVAQIPTSYDLVNIGPQLTRIRAAEKADNLFLLSMLKNPSYNQKLLSINSGSAMNFVGLTAIGAFEFKAPRIEEQEKIGNYFQQLDSLIYLQNTKLKKLKNIKKSCLEKMFV